MRINDRVVERISSKDAGDIPAGTVFRAKTGMGRQFGVFLKTGNNAEFCDTAVVQLDGDNKTWGFSSTFYDYHVVDAELIIS